MVQILPQHDPGKEIGQSFGSGMGDAMKLLGQRQLAMSALDKLGELDTKDMSDMQIAQAVGKATVGLPHMQNQASDIMKLLLDRKKATGVDETYQNIANRNKGTAPTTEETVTDVTAEVSTQQPGVQQGQQGQQPGQRGQQGQFPNTAPMREIPTIQDQTGTGPLLSPEQVQEITAPLIAAGAYAEIPGAISKAEQNQLQKRELQLQEASALREEQSAKRALESELAQNVLGRTEKLMQSKGLPMGSLDEWKRLSYKYFQDEREKPANADASDEQVWSEAGRRLEQKVEDLATAGSKHYRPTWRMDKERRAKGAQDWAQKHLGTYGNNNEERQLIKSIMMDNGWTREEATSIVQPMSPKLKQTVKSIGKRPPSLTSMSANQAAIQGPKREEEISVFIDNMVPKVRQGVKPSDSLLLLKSQLVRDNGLTDDQAIDVIERIQEPYTVKGDKGEMIEKKLALQNHQIQDLNFLQENVRPSPYDIFFSDRRAIEIMEPLIK